ncbi:MAG TPA: DUF2249 domain-containing protein [Acidimicrobiales bacterium]|nr:DUF2249 domain-containing protein [Acidimicrobiales bacterium]
MSNNDQVAQAIRDHHARLVSDLQAHVELLGQEVAAGHDHRGAAQAVLSILEGQVLPHAAAEEQVLYPLASRRDDLRTLIEAMIAEHRYIQSAVAALRSTSYGLTAAIRAEAISTVFRLHAEKENDFVLPALATDPGVDLAATLAGMHELLDSEPATEEADAAGDGVLDVRPLPPARRHQLIFSTFDSLEPGQAFELVNDHDPKPLRYQLSAEHPDQFSWDYLEAGPTAWRVRIARTAA